MFNIDTYAYPEGLRLLGRWQSGDLDGKLELTKVIDAAIAGELDNCFKLTELPDRVHTTACMQMLGLGVLNDLYGIESWEYSHTVLRFDEFVNSNLAKNAGSGQIRGTNFLLEILNNMPCSKAKYESLRPRW